MHNVFNVQRITLEFLLNICGASDGAAGLGTFYRSFSDLEGLSARGEITASFARCRQITDGAALLLTPVMLAHNDLEFRSYAHLATFTALLSRHLYSEEPSTPKRRLRFALLGFFAWLFVVQLSAKQGGATSATGYTKNHAQTVYFVDMAQHMPAFEERYRMPWPWVTEENFEQDFNTHTRCSAGLHSKTSLAKERQYRERERLLRQVVPRTRYHSEFSTFPETPYTDIIVHPSIFTTTTTPLGFKGGTARETGAVHLAGVNFRKLLLTIAGREGQSQYVERGLQGEWIFRVGDSHRQTSPIELCFPENEGHAEAERTIFCKCKTGKCVACVCKINNLQCTPKCHKQRDNDNCTRPSLQQPVHVPPGVQCRCQPLDDAAESLTAFAARRQAKVRAMTAAERQSFFEHRLTRAFTQMASLRTVHKKSPLHMRRRKFAAAWLLTRRIVELQRLRHVQLRSRAWTMIEQTYRTAVGSKK